jgi:hypothetical protein
MAQSGHPVDIYFVGTLVKYICMYSCRAAGASRVARWFILTPKIPILVYSGGPWNGKCWYIFRPFGIIYDDSV